MNEARAKARAPVVYAIPAGLPFADALAEALLGRGPLSLHSADPLAIARAEIFVPTRRAARALSDALVRQSGARATLLPRIRPFGDLDDDEPSLDGDGIGGLDALPPAADPLSRDFLLMRLVMAWQMKKTGKPSVRADEAAQLARALGRFIDELHSERVDPAALKDLAPERFAAHWQEIVAFLAIVTHEWPLLLERIGLMDHVARRNAVLEALAQRWTKDPPPHPVIAAGSTGSLPATADLIAAIARLPKGAVVLPGLDRTLDDEAWAALDPSHPQFGLKNLTERLGVPRSMVTDLGATPQSRAARLALIAEALRPAITTEVWRNLPALDASALIGLARVECANEDDEAGVIALKLRETLETPTKTAALVTADRGLARRVVARLERYGIEVDDSAGRPLALTPPGAFLRLIGALAIEQVAPVSLLALLKHPLAAGGLAPETFRRQVRALELACLRGPRPSPGFNGVRAALDDAIAEAKTEPRRKELGALSSWLDRVTQAYKPFADSMAAPRATIAALLAAHIGLAEWLAATDREHGPSRLWAGEAGERAASFVADIAEAAADAPEIAPASYPALIEALMAGLMVRPSRPRHSRLSIWGPLEARLQSADLMILGGLNEGSWPPEPKPDPWLSRPMRAAVGLSPPERRIGLAAHDFVQCCGAPEVLLTHARRAGTSPTIASRWLTRLDALIGLVAPNARAQIDAHHLRAWQSALDAPARVEPCAPPAPRPPLHTRPRQLSVTAVETWLADPYSIYARYILRLKPLDELDADPGAAERGSLIHDVFDAFVRDHPRDLPDHALAQLIEAGRARFAALAHRPTIMAFWWPRFERIAAWFIEAERERRAEGTHPCATEISGTLSFDAPGGTFTLSAKADRIDRKADGALVIIDYKTGTVPSKNDVENGKRAQLPLEAAIALARGFGAAVPDAPVTALEYWRLSGGEEPGKVIRVGKDAEALARRLLARLQDYVAGFDDPTMPYRVEPRPSLIRPYQDYAHLARIGEWSVEPAP
ncbi:MAG: double-strand break repair protein AddB [Alphaproteobacteria bacterium]|nr:double-strand break repair protein AddB [Alphaproteobacteria bacterium]